MPGGGVIFLKINVCFSNPTTPPKVPMGLVKCRVQCLPAYTLSPPAFKGVTRGMDFKKTQTLLLRIVHENIKEGGVRSKKAQICVMSFIQY